MNLSKIFGEIKKRRLLVIGDVVLDRYIWGKVSRISPEAPVPVVDVMNDSYMLGGAANVGNNIVSLGGGATVIGVVGEDRAGDIVEGLLDEKGISSVLVRDKRPTTVKTRVIAHSQQVVRFDREDREKAGGKTLRALLDSVKKAVPEHDAVIISDYKKGVVSTELMKTVISSSRGGFVSVDPKVGHFHLYRNASLITPNLAEASHGSSVEIRDEPTLIKAGGILLKKLGLRAVLITRGEEGMTLFEKGGHTHIPTLARDVYDVTGAGDTVIAAFTLLLSTGARLGDCAVFANHAAGIVVGEVGTAVATPEKMRKSFGNGPSLRTPR